MLEKISDISKRLMSFVLSLMIYIFSGMLSFGLILLLLYRDWETNPMPESPVDTV